MRCNRDICHDALLTGPPKELRRDKNNKNKKKSLSCPDTLAQLAFNSHALPYHSPTPQCFT